VKKIQIQSQKLKLTSAMMMMMFQTILKKLIFQPFSTRKKYKKLSQSQQFHQSLYKKLPKSSLRKQTKARNQKN